ncbi:MAG: hypothetical protein HQL57_03645 [Magnetococcales bacterium]|nr:hypothetical protein [Magnetococcales bacterium]MBF0156262.1 hypothetical protein [Magnetococcales bacterium]
MAIRVTQNQLFQGTAQAMQSQQRDLQRVQEKTLTGNRTNRPSDDPTGTFRHLLYSSDLDGVASLKKTTDFASQRMRLADANLEEMHTRMLSAQDLVLRLGNDFAGGDPSILTAASEEAVGIYQDLFKAMNQELDGVPVFGGARTRSPFTESRLTTTPVLRRTGNLDTMHEAANVLVAEVTEEHGLTDIPLSVKLTYEDLQGTWTVDVNGQKREDLKATGTPPKLDLGGGLTVTVLATPTDRSDAYFFEVVPKYQGSGEDRAVKSLNGRVMLGNVTGAEVIEGEGFGRDINIFGVLAGMRGALLRHDNRELAARLTQVQECRAQLADMQSLTGIRNTQVDAVNHTLQLDETTLSGVKATNVEADLFAVLTDLEKTTQAMQVMSTSQRQILNTSLLDFLR